DVHDITFRSQKMRQGRRTARQRPQDHWRVQRNCIEGTDSQSPRFAVSGFGRDDGHTGRESSEGRAKKMLIEIRSVGGHGRFKVPAKSKGGIRGSWGQALQVPAAVALQLVGQSVVQT